MKVVQDCVDTVRRVVRYYALVRLTIKEFGESDAGLSKFMLVFFSMKCIWIAFDTFAKFNAPVKDLLRKGAI